MSGYGAVCCSTTGMKIGVGWSIIFINTITICGHRIFYYGDVFLGASKTLNSRETVLGSV